MSNQTGLHGPMHHTGTTGFPAGMSRMTPTVPRTVMRHHDNKDMEIIPGGSGWSQTIPTTSNLSRAELTNGTVLSFEIVRLPLVYTTGVLPICVDLISYNDDGDVVTVKETDRVHGLPHMNTAHNMTLTDGTLKQHTRSFHFEQYATDVAEMPTPFHYSKLVNLGNKFYVDQIEKIWADAKGRMLRTLDLMVRRAMKIEFPTQYNLQTDDAECRRMMLGTYNVMKRFPQDWLTSVYSSVVEGMSNRGFRLADGVAGNILLVPRQACVEEFGDARKTIKPLTAHENEDPYSLYHAFRLENGQVVGTATRTGNNFQLGRFTVYPYDEIQTQGDDLPDSFFERRLIPSSIVIPRGTVSAVVDTPQGKTEHTPVDLAISAGLYYENCCLDNAAFDGTNHYTTASPGGIGNYFDRNQIQWTKYDPKIPPFPPTIGGTWALQTDDGAAALCGWLETVASNLKSNRLDEIKGTIKRRTGFEPKSIDPDDYLDGAHQGWFEETHKFLYNRLHGQNDDMARKICLLALLPGSRKILSFLHELSPFTICNFNVVISPWATCADIYLMHPKPMTAITSDNFVGMFQDPTKYGVKRWRIHSRVVVFRHSTEPDIRIADAFITGVNCLMHTLTTARDIKRGLRHEDEERSSDAFAIFSGISNSFPDWCRFGPDSITRLPAPVDIEKMFGDDGKPSAKHMNEMLQSNGWNPNGPTVVSDVARECPVEGWVPWTATLNKADQTVVELKGMGQPDWR